MLKHVPADNNDTGKKGGVLNTFNENVTLAAELEVKIHDMLVQLSADETLKL
jgi:hypothetical protein